MKIGLLVDGKAEYHGFPHLLPRIETPHRLLTHPLLCDLQPFASPAQIAHVAAKSFPILLNRGADLIVLLVDKETRPEYTAELAQAIEREARERLTGLTTTADVRVVLKVTKLENWLVADPDALRSLSGLFEHVERIEKQVSPGRADAVDAYALLCGASRKPSYDKKRGAMEVCKKLDPVRAGRNSRSFRKLLKTLGCPEASAATAGKPSRRR